MVVRCVQVTETFNKIGTPNTSMLGLETLYNLLEENPMFPVEDLLSRTSEPFRQYIHKGLNKVLLQSETVISSACPEALMMLSAMVFYKTRSRD